MKIGELAKKAHCSVQAIRYYEKEGLIDPGQRSEGNFRLYGKQALGRLQFIRGCRGLDMPLAEVRDLLALQQSPDAPCDSINRLIDSRLEEVEKRTRELHQLRRQLQNLQRRCGGGGTVQECPILQGLNAVDDCTE